MNMVLTHEKAASVIEYLGLALYSPMVIDRNYFSCPEDIVIYGDKKEIASHLMKIKVFIAKGIIVNATLENVRILRTDIVSTSNIN